MSHRRNVLSSEAGKAEAQRAGVGFAEEASTALWSACRKWSLPMGRLLGVDLRINLLTILAIGLLYADTEDILHFHLHSITFSTLLSSFVVHELGHAVTARFLGGKVRGIILAPPFLGLTFMEIDEERHFRNAVIFFSGPLANLCVSALVYPLIAVSSHHSFMLHLWAERLVIMNLAIGAINLIPFFPLDGGRLLREVLLLCRLRRRTADIATLCVACPCFFAISAICWVGKDYIDLAVAVLLAVVSFLSLTGSRPGPQKTVEQQASSAEDVAV